MSRYPRLRGNQPRRRSLAIRNGLDCQQLPQRGAALELRRCRLNRFWLTAGTAERVDANAGGTAQASRQSGRVMLGVSDRLEVCDLTNVSRRNDGKAQPRGCRDRASTSSASFVKSSRSGVIET